MQATFGSKIREARKAKKYTQRELANLIGAKHNSVSDWENDKNKPDPDTIELLCGVLDLSPNYLLASNSNNESITLREKGIIKKYRTLDAHGKDMVDTILDKEYDRVCESAAEYDYLEPVAAHQRTDIEVTDEMIAHDDDLMDNFDNF
ncbi:MAG: helix-turn-helix transcriptional regulator [Eubacteriales bacterium]|nr:helix-turn-helix transcriptional regulator [Eubacteriales bacterium]